MSELHIRGISTTLALLDETLCNFELWAKGHEAHGVLYREVNAFSPAEREAILKGVRKARAILQGVRDRLGLEPKVQDIASAVWAWCWTSLEPLEELEGRFLKRYGAPPAELAEYMDPQVAALSEQLQAIQKIAFRARGRTAAPEGAESPKGEPSRGQEPGPKTG